MDIVKLDVGGTLFVTTEKTLATVPDTRLSAISKSSAEYNKETNTYFFDRNPELFNWVLDYYRTGELHLPKNVCGAAIRNEMEYWQIGSGSISDCCLSSLFNFEDELEVCNNLKVQFESAVLEYSSDDIQSSKWNRTKSIIWNFMEKPDSSRPARIFSVIYFLLVLATCVTFILGSLRVFREDIHLKVNETYEISIYTRELLKHKNEKIALVTGTHETPALYYIHVICIIFFTIDLILRFIACPKRKVFFKNFLNVIDLIIVVAMWIAFILVSTNVDLTSSNSLLWTYLVAKGFIILRLLRVFRLGKHVSGLKVLYLSMKASWQELGLLLLMFLITTSLFGSVIYYAEFFQPSHFDSVAIGIWWAIVTLTTVGYGDYYPTSPPGYVIGAMCSVCGLLLLSMPIAIIATNFNNYYTKNKTRQKQLKRKNDLFTKLRTFFTPKPRRTAAAANFGKIRQNLAAVGKDTSDISFVAKKEIKTAFVVEAKQNQLTPSKRIF